MIPVIPRGEVEWFMLGQAQAAQESNWIEEIGASLSATHPDLHVLIDPPVDPYAASFLDVWSDRKPTRLVIEWRAGFGIGISRFLTGATTLEYGEGPQEIYRSLDEAQGRIEELVNSLFA